MPLQSACLRARDLAGRWFLDSGIQEPFGGVARYYRSDLCRNLRVSTEITGYAAATLAWLHALTGERAYLEAALRAGRFLTRTAWDRAALLFPFEYSVDGDVAPPLAYFFDHGITLRGLLSLWRVTGDAEFLETATRSAPAMARDFDAGREFHPVLALPGKEPAPGDARWSRKPGCYQLKSALAFRELFAATGEARFREAYDRVLDYSLETHASFLDAPPGPALMDRLHAYCYFLEGLLPCANRPEIARVFAAGIERTGRLGEELAPEFERSDVRAQLFRLRLFAARLGLAPLAADAAAHEAARILEFQLERPDARLRGGFCFGRRGSQLLPFVNPASTAFCVQALEMWRAHQAGQFEPAWQVLI
ncbi:MAG: hypothetical protein AAB225_24140 [Acidobacteriota bacterium]